MRERDGGLSSRETGEAGHGQVIPEPSQLELLRVWDDRECVGESGVPCVCTLCVCVCVCVCVCA